jgi:hypothetical protein
LDRYGDPIGVEDEYGDLVEVVGKKKESNTERMGRIRHEMNEAARKKEDDAEVKRDKMNDTIGNMMEAITKSIGSKGEVQEEEGKAHAGEGDIMTRDTYMSECKVLREHCDSGLFDKSMHTELMKDLDKEFKRGR